MLTCIKPMYAPIMPGIFSRENERYGATMCVDETCHADPKRVTKIEKSHRKINKFMKPQMVLCRTVTWFLWNVNYSPKMTRPTNKLKVTVKNVVNLCKWKTRIKSFLFRHDKNRRRQQQQRQTNRTKMHKTGFLLAPICFSVFTCRPNS